MYDKETIKIQAAEGSRPPPSFSFPLDALGLKMGAQVVKLVGTTLTLTNDHHGKILDFLASGAVTVTVPAGLRRDFYVAISQGGSGQVTLSASGVTINEVDGNLATEGQYALVTLVAFNPDDYRLFGRTA